MQRSQAGRPARHLELHRVSQTLSRRELAKRGLALAAAASLPSALIAQDPKPPIPTVAEEEAGEIEAMLAMPLGDRAKTLLRAAVASNKSSSKERLKTKLPENSEPCVRYIPTPAREPRG
jgi:hypothetical protein